MDLESLKNRYPMGLASPAMDLDDFEHLYRFEKNGISILEVSPIVTDNKSWQVGDPHSIRNFIDLCQKHKVKTGSLHCFYMAELGHDMTDADPAIRKQAIDLNLEMFEAAQEVGAAFIVMHVFNEKVQRTKGEALFYAKEALKELLPKAEKTGVAIAVENLHYKWTISQINQLLDELNHPLLGICLDTGHAALYSTPQAELALCKDRLLGFHIHDNWLEDDDHLIPFRGKINWSAFCQTLLKNGYQGTLMFESFNRKENETVDQFIDTSYQSYLNLLQLISSGPE
ncbi:MAG: sugar phosphate isomerase/epimerase [Deltaproteobacteria bacterium]|jgi:sugar phosphate isomerase/epimerase|nr:sugar phosphate isomerase/epimerase [Deltaproteobacteria bacterium]MBT4265170.1 sugar phosphate isomerase/epimerase [Deltaproteobacteria bacterium]MBT4638639.1 sugar phosphate isomerase/epimerase [Deltaproteobacteria bacterium]MBT6503498.1 sugar phosphate isomerase/epimerase [Deltaproteobacteria bacterium]MBT6611626.1 sugar phosphate isomerase/epimerase [Deltaproteobacteria bacterium]